MFTTDPIRICALIWAAFGLAYLASAVGAQPATSASAATGTRMILLDFDGDALPVNRAGDSYPIPYDGRNTSRREGGLFTTSLNKSDAVVGRSLQLRLTEGAFYAQFNPFDHAGNRSFARDYCQNPQAWEYNTYNRMRFWIKLPTSATKHHTDGRSNLNVGTYVKRLQDADPRSDETGGNHYYHNINILPLGHWTQVILNMHPDHRRGNSGQIDLGNLPHPTGEADYNYFDTLTRFYIQDEAAPSQYPADYLLDQIEFYQEKAPEDDERVYSITATYVAEANRLIVCWRRLKSDPRPHEVRYAFQSVHALGWDAAVAASKGLVKPLEELGYNGMIYDTTELPLAGQKMVYIAMRPQGAVQFSEIEVPLNPR